MNLLAAVATARWVPLIATAVPLITPALGAVRSVIAISAIAIRECRMYSMADLARSARPFSDGFWEPFRGTDKEEAQRSAWPRFHRLVGQR